MADQPTKVIFVCNKCDKNIPLNMCRIEKEATTKTDIYVHIGCGGTIRVRDIRDNGKRIIG